MKSESNKSESTHQDEIVQGYRGLLNWGQRVAGECGIVGTQSNFQVIEDTLNRQRERIAELEAQAAKEAQETVEMEWGLTGSITELEMKALYLKREIAIRDASIQRAKSERDVAKERIKKLEAENASQRNHINMLEQQAATYGRWLRELKDENAALVSQSASGAGVQMEYCWKQYGYSDGEIDHANTWARAGGWTLHHIEGVADNYTYVLVVWQRPARREGTTEAQYIAAIHPLTRLTKEWNSAQRARQLDTATKNQDVDTKNEG
jgi:hypothetical protein